MKIRKIRLFILLCIMIVNRQQLPAQDSLLRQAIEHAAADYMATVSQYAALYTGKRPPPLTLTIRNNRYFKDEKFVNGRLSFGGIVYPDVLLRWDLYRDDLFILTPSNNDIALKSDNVDFAVIHGYYILDWHSNNMTGCPATGYYILLYWGEYLLLEKPTVYTTNFYLLKNWVYYKINNQRTLLKSLDTHRAELKQFIHANKLKYKTDAEKMVLEVVKHHEKLNRL